MEKIKKILSQISKIVVEEKTLQEEKRKRGENFNIFKVLGLSTSEVRLHSAFLAELLNPNGDHGLGGKFLDSFLSRVICNKLSFLFDIDSAQVYVEYPIGNISDDYKEGGRIDLLINDKNRQTIIIENKIYAGDQPFQMYRYNEYARKILNKEQYVLLYLTLNGKLPSEGSMGNSSFDYLSISYRDDILPWLDDCIAIAALHPRIRETITQYNTTLKHILSMMENNNTERYLDILTSSDNILTTIDILEHSHDIQTKIREDLINSIQHLCNTLGLSFICDEGVKFASNFSWMHIFDEKYKNIQFVIGVRNHTNQDGFRMCFIVESKQKPIEQFLFWDDGEKPTDEYPFGWVYLWSDSGKPGSGHWWRWDEWSTLRDMANGKMLNFIKTQLQRIKEENTFKYMNELVSKSED